MTPPLAPFLDGCSFRRKSSAAPLGQRHLVCTLVYAPTGLRSAQGANFIGEKAMADRTTDLDETIKRTEEAEKELASLIKRTKGDLERLVGADHIVTGMLGETRDHPKEPPDSSQPEELVD